MLVLINSQSLFAFMTSSVQEPFNGTIVDGNNVVIPKAFTLILNGTDTPNSNGTFQFTNSSIAAQIDAKVNYHGLTVFGDAPIDIIEPMKIIITQQVVQVQFIGCGVEDSVTLTINTTKISTSCQPYYLLSSGNTTLKAEISGFANTTDSVTVGNDFETIKVLTMVKFTPITIQMINSTDQPIDLIFQSNINGVITNSSATGLFTFTPTLNTFLLTFTYQGLIVGSNTFEYSTASQTLKLTTRVVKLSFTDCGSDPISFVVVTNQSITCGTPYYFLKEGTADITITASSAGYADSTTLVTDVSLTTFENHINIKMNKYVNIDVQMQDVNGTPIAAVFQTTFNGNPLNSSAAGVFTFLPNQINTTLVVTYQSLAMGSKTFSYDNTTQNMKVADRIVKVSFTNCNDSINLSFNNISKQTNGSQIEYYLLPLVNFSIQVSAIGYSNLQLDIAPQNISDFETPIVFAMIKYQLISLQMLDVNNTQLQQSGFQIEIAGITSNCTNMSICSFIPTQNQTNVLIKYQSLIVANQSIDYQVLQQNVTVQQLLQIMLNGCDNYQISMQYLNITEQIQCDQNITSKWFIVFDSNVTFTFFAPYFLNQTVLFDVSTKKPFITQLSVSMTRDQTVIFQLQNVGDLSNFNFTVNINGTNISIEGNKQFEKELESKMYNMSVYYKDITVFNSQVNGSVKSQSINISSVLVVNALCEANFTLTSPTSSISGKCNTSLYIVATLATYTISATNYSNLLLQIQTINTFEVNQSVQPIKIDQLQMFSIQLQPFNISCENVSSVATFNNSFNTTSYGCTPVFKWTISDYKMVLNQSILVQIESLNIVYLIQNISNELQVNTFKPTVQSQNITLLALTIDVKSLLKQGYDCPDFMLMVNISSITVFNGMTNGMCQVPITFNTALSVGQSLAIKGTPIGYKPIAKQTTLTTQTIQDLKNNGFTFNAQTDPGSNGGTVAGIIIGVIIVVGIIIGAAYFIIKKKGLGVNSKQISTHETKAYH